MNDPINIETGEREPENTVVQRAAQLLVTGELARQYRLKLRGDFSYTSFDMPGLSEEQKLALLVEEIGEISECVQTRAGMGVKGDPSSEALVRELVQLQAIAQGWVERMLISSDLRVSLDDVLDPRD